MRKNSWFTVLLLFPFLALAQTAKTDSLRTLLSKTTQEQKKVDLLNSLAAEYKATDSNTMLHYATQAYTISQQVNYTSGMALASQNMAGAYIVKSDYKQALNKLSFSADLYSGGLIKNEEESQRGLAKTQGMYGIVFSELSNYTKALEFYLKSVAVYEKLKDAVMCAKLYNNIGVIYRSQKLYPKALFYFEKAKQIQSRNPDEDLAVTYTNIANSQTALNRLDEAEFNYHKAKLILDKFPYPRALGEWYNNMGILFRQKGNKSQAVVHWDEAIKVFNQIDDKFGVADSYLHLGELYFNQNNTDKALQNAKVCLSLARETGVMEQQVLAEKLLSDIYAKMGDDKSSRMHLENYIIVKDKLISEENIRKSEQIALYYEFEKKQQEQKLLHQEQTKRTRMGWMFLFFTAVLLMALGFLWYNRNQVKTRLTLQKELAEYEQKALHLQMNPHFVFNCLGSISGFIVNNSTQEAITYLAKFSKLMRLTLEYSKESLIPVDKEIESLKNYLELEQLRYNHKFDFSLAKDNTIEDDMAIPPLLVQPLVENAIIHGIVPATYSGQIHIEFKATEKSLFCIITDNGIGVQAARQRKENSVTVHKSMAIDIIRKRLGKIQSTTGKVTHLTLAEVKQSGKIAGTKVTLELPIQFIETL